MLLQKGDHPEIVHRDADRPAVADLGAQRERALVEGARGVVVAAVLGDDAEIRQQAAHARLVSHPLADLQTRLVILDRLRVIAALRRDGADEMQHPSDAAFLAQRPEAARGAIEALERLVVAPLLARHLGERRVTRGPRVVVAETLGERERLAVDLLGAMPVADELEHLAELE